MFRYLYSYADRKWPEIIFLKFADNSEPPELVTDTCFYVPVAAKYSIFHNKALFIWNFSGPTALNSTPLCL